MMDSRLRNAAENAPKIDGGFRLFQTGGLDSMDFVELLTQIDEQLGHALVLEELDFVRLETVDALVEQLHDLQHGEPAGD